MQYYSDLFAEDTSIDLGVVSSLVVYGNVIEFVDHAFLSTEITSPEIKAPLFFMAPSKAPCPNGFTVVLQWVLQWEDLCEAIKYCFSSGFFPKFFSATCIHLIPKSAYASTLRDLRLILAAQLLIRLAISFWLRG